MEKISVEQSGIRAELERGITEEREVKKKMAKGFFGMAGITAGIFIMLAVVAAVTTEIKLREFEDFAAFALDFFLLLFCAYSMYLTCSDSGMRSGLGTEAYRETVEGFAIQNVGFLYEIRKGGAEKLAYVRSCRCGIFLRRV